MKLYISEHPRLAGIPQLTTPTKPSPALPRPWKPANDLRWARAFRTSAPAPNRAPRHRHERSVPADISSLGTVLAVWAHPDDESFVAGGLLAAASDAGSRVVCLTATRGERGTADADRWNVDRLARTRTHELAAAHAVLGVAEQRWMSFDDGGCDSVSAGLGMALVAKAIEDVRPDTIVTFGPDGFTGHSDHQAVSRWTSNAWAATGSTARLLWAAITPSVAQRMAIAEPVAGAFYPGYPHVTNDRQIALRLDLSGELLDRKVTAIRAHASQSAAVAHRLGEDRFEQWWSTETYVDVGAIAARAGHAGAPRRMVLASAAG